MGFRLVGSDNQEFNFKNNTDLNFDINFNFDAADIPMDDTPFAEEFQLAGTPRPKQTATKVSDSRSPCC